MPFFRRAGLAIVAGVRFWQGGCPAVQCRPRRRTAMKGIGAWLLGIPIPIIILLYLFDVF